LNRLEPPEGGFDAASRSAALWSVFLWTLGFNVVLFGVRTVLRRLVARSGLATAVRARYPGYDVLTYLPLLVFTLGAFGVRFPLITSSVVLATVFLILQAALLSWLAPAADRAQAFASIQWLSCLFFLSGFAAIIYQVAWQRELFASFGVNIESVTVIVSLFMFGLGVGSLVGGLLSRRWPQYAPQLFFLCEVGIGLFGLVSMPLIERVSAATLHGSLAEVSLATYALLCLPTICMGATLPILVGHLNRYYENVGKSVGLLYFINTVGSAVACLVTADILFVFLGLRGAVLVAACCNLLVAVLVYRYTRRIERDKAAVASPAEEESPEQPVRQPSGLRLSLVLILAAATGYVSLSQEILWFRVISYITAGRPQVFAHLLAFFLFGIAAGALIAKRVCEARRDVTLPFIAGMLTLSGLCYYFSIPFVARLLTQSATGGENACFLMVALIALLVGSTFPVLCHYAIRTKTSTGLLLSWVYFANILGATAGPLVTGFVLLEAFSLEQNVLFVSAATLALAAVTWAACSSGNVYRLALGAVAAAIPFGLWFIHQGVFAHTLERLHFKTKYAAEQPYRYLVQNRSGIVAVKVAHPDRVCGGGSYDGEINLDPTAGEVGVANHIRKAYWFAALHPEPAEVLVIGLATGSWARVVADHAAVKKCTVVEINPGYVNLIEHYPEVRSLLDDPKVTIYADDARRWLKRRPGAKFDCIVMDTTAHWRDHITNILSAEFLRLCQSRLKPGGVMYLNTTGSEDVVFTTASVFKYIVRNRAFAAGHYTDRKGTFVAGSDTPFTMSSKQRRGRLQQFYRGGKPVFGADSPVLDELANQETNDEGPEFRSRTDLWCITDDNVATEFKRYHRWFDPNGKWGQNHLLAQLFTGSTP
jgi:spermidine synthase